MFKGLVAHINFLRRIVSASITDADAIRASAATISWMVLLIYTSWALVDNILYPELIMDSLLTRLPIGVLAGISILLIRTNRFPIPFCEILVLAQGCLCMFQLFYFLWANDFHYVYGVGLLIVGTVSILAQTRSSFCFLFIIVSISIYVFLASVHGWTEQDRFFLVAIMTTFGLGVMQTAFRIRLVNDLADERLALRHQVDVSVAMSTAMQMSAHDLMSPLTAVNAFIEQIPDKDHRDLVKQAVGKINFLASDLLKLGKHERGNRNRSYEGAISNKDIYETLKYLRSLLNFKYQNRIQLESSGLQKCSARIDNNELERVVMNIIVNALEASQEIVRVSCELNEGIIQISILDSGPGIPETLEKKVFAGGYTSKGEKGHGLGLLSVQKILAERNGKLTYTRLQPGSCFVVSLPEDCMGKLASGKV